MTQLDSLPPMKPKEKTTLLVETIRLGGGCRDAHMVCEAFEPDVNDTHNGWTPLLLAVKLNDPKLVDYLVDRGADLESTMATTKHTALLLAIVLKHNEIAEFLVQRGANVNARSSEGTNALLLALKVSNMKMVRYLVHHKKICDVNAKDASGQSIMGMVMHLIESPTLPLHLCPMAEYLKQNQWIVEEIYRWSLTVLSEK